MTVSIYRLLYFAVVTSLLVSCKIRSEVMFKHSKDYVFQELVLDTSSAEYSIQPYDVISFAVYTSDGATILESSTGPVEMRMGGWNQFMELTVSSEGQVDLPVVGNVKIDGLTVRQAQEIVENEFEKMFNKPYVIIRVKNRRVVVFTSPDGTGRVVELGEQFVSVIDAVALAGGIGLYAEASKVMLFRDENGQQISYMIDLSTIEGAKYASAPVESGDVIYVESRPRYTQRLVDEVRPFLVILSSVSIFFSIISLTR
jgi:polysaccharide export outer membrane protein